LLQRDSSGQLPFTEIQHEIDHVLFIPIASGHYGFSDRKLAEIEKEKLIVVLQKAPEQIKTLQGIVPTGSHCKKVRNDEGY